jgi:DNA recombination protein RmuC
VKGILKMVESILAISCGALALFLAAAVYLWMKEKASGGGEAQMESLQRENIFAQRNFETRIQEKEEAFRKLMAAKDEACARALAEKDEMLSRMLKEKDAACEKTISEKNAEIERFLQEKEKSFAEVVKTLQEKFALLAAQTLKTQSGDLAKANSDQLESVLKPLREQLDTLRSATEKTQTEHAKLAEAIGKDVGRISDVAKELAGVSEALSSNSGFQGRKGEEILAEKLRQAGLEEGVNFFLQSGTASDRPDAQVCDTENRWLIIDSKVVLTSYFQYVEAKDEETRKRKLAEHVARVREKVDQLAKKKYPAVFSAEYKDRNYLPVTAMFVGYEAPLLEALKAEPSLWKYAADNNVILVTPLTLLAYLRLVYLAWQHEKESRNQENIVNAARELLTRMNTFLITFENMGKALCDAQAKYNDAHKVLVDEPRAHTIAKAANKLIDLHVKLENRKGKRIERASCLETEATNFDIICD